MERLITFVLSNPSLSCFVLGLIAAVIALIGGPKPVTTARVADALLAYHVLFAVGLNYLVNFVFHSFFGEMTARFIGWADSPFQLEVAFASLGFAVVGFLAFRGSFDLRLAAVVGPAFFLLGAAGGHIYQMVSQHNFAPGNAGVIFYMDIILPVVGFLLLWLQHRHPVGRPALAAAQ